MIQVTITIDNGNITVAKIDGQQDASQTQDPNALPQQSQTPDADGDTDNTQGQQVPDLKTALLLAAKILMSDDTKSTYDQAFDQGMAKNQPGNVQGQQAQ